MKSIYFFNKGQSCPGWLYVIRNNETGEEVPCSFDTDGFVAVLDDDRLAIWPSADRKDDEYIFTFEPQYLPNATAGHPQGDELLTVFTSEPAAREALGDGVDGASIALPDSGPGGAMA